MDATLKTQPIAYSVSGLAVQTSLSKQTIYAEIDAGRLRSKRVRNRIVIPRVAVDEWLAAQ